MVKQTKLSKSKKLNRIKKSKKVKNLKKTIKKIGGDPMFNTTNCQYFGFSNNNSQISEKEKLIREKTILECKRDKLINTKSPFNYKNRTSNIVNITQQILNIENQIKSPIEYLQKKIEELENKYKNLSASLSTEKEKFPLSRKINKLKEELKVLKALAPINNLNNGQ